MHEANSRFEARYPGDPTARQPVHVVYGGAQRFRFDTAAKFGKLALETLRQYGSPYVPETIHRRVVMKLEREPVEDYRIDFEDGYGSRSDAEEDEHADQAGRELARGFREGTLPPFTGIRIKALTNVLAGRAWRTLERFIDAAVDERGGLPENFAVTLPKVTVPDQVSVLDEMLSEIERRFEIANRIAVELMIETPQALINDKGVCAIPAMVEAAGGRCRGIHFGPYDYTSSLNIASTHQSLSHPACDFARQTMLAAVAGTGISVSDGPTKLLPVPVHRGGADLTEAQVAENRAAVNRGMAAHTADIRRALRDGIYQGWDLHPAQLPTRYAATYAFFREGLEAAANRLRNFLDDAQQATLLGNLFDDAASGQGLLNFFLRGHACGALDDADVALTGLTMEEIRGRSFMRILREHRREG